MAWLRASERGHANPRREGATISCRRIEECTLWNGAGHDSGPDDMNGSGRIHGQCRSIIGTPIELPSVFADARRWRKRPARIPRHAERDVAQIPWIDMAPRGVQRAVRSHDQGAQMSISCARRRPLRPPPNPNVQLPTSKQTQLVRSRAVIRVALHCRDACCTFSPDLGGR